MADVERDPRDVDGDEDEDEMGLGGLMPRSPSPEPDPFSFATYPVPTHLSSLVGGRESIEVRLVGSHPLWGHYLWNTSLVLTSYLLTHPGLYTNLRTLELGAGAALPSIACALAGAKTAVATDYSDESLLSNIRFNAGLSDADLRVVGHTWGTDTAELLEVDRGETDGRYDLVILSDLMFNHSQHDALIRTLDATLSHTLPTIPTSSGSTSAQLSPSTPCALVFFTHHRPHLAHADMAFFPRLVSGRWRRRRGVPGGTKNGESSDSDDEEGRNGAQIRNGEGEEEEGAGKVPDQGEGNGWAYERVCEEWTGPMFKDDRGDERVRGTVHGFRCWRTSV